MNSLPFRDRVHAGQRLAAALERYRGSDPVVLAIPRGAVPIARIVSEQLDGELDVVFVRKLGAPGNAELAVGAIDEQGAITVNEHAQWVGADERYIRREADRQSAVIRARRARYRPGQAPIALNGRTVIVVDDGLATGSTMLAALKSVRRQQPARLICAVPVAAADSLAQVAEAADEVVCLATPRPFNAVGHHYRDFSSVSDEEVVEIFREMSEAPATQSPAPALQVRIPAGDAVLAGDLMQPAAPRGLVIFAHGSGSSRLSARNRFVAESLYRRGMSTLLFDLLTPTEDRSIGARFDIPLLARRLEAAVDWAQADTALGSLPIGLFGASTGAAAALVVAAARADEVAAVVSRGGRPDLAGAQALSQIRTHTLLLVGSADLQVMELNRQAQTAMGEWAELGVVPGAGYLFEETGALEQVADLAGDWFLRWL